MDTRYKAPGTLDMMTRARPTPQRGASAEGTPLSGLSTYRALPDIMSQLGASEYPPNVSSQMDAQLPDQLRSLPEHELRRLFLNMRELNPTVDLDQNLEMTAEAPLEQLLKHLTRRMSYVAPSKEI